MKYALLVLAISFFCFLSEAQNKNKAYYNQHPSEILPDAQTAFKNADYERAEKLCEWYYIIVGDKSADDLRSKASLCATLSAEIKELEAAGKKEDAQRKRKDILALNPDDEKTKKELDDGDSPEDYLEISRVLFANIDKDWNLLTDYGGTLYKEEIKYVNPKIWYNGFSSEEKQVKLDFKIYNPDGSLKTGNNSPSGYTWSETRSISAGKANAMTLLGWGRDDGGGYSAGSHTFEIWSNGNKLYSATFVIKEKANALSKGEWRTSMKKALAYATSTYNNGDVYKGQYADGDKSGLGVYKWESGSYYWGRWKNGDMNGMAIYVATDDSKHVINCPDCKYYVGYYSNDQKNGTGTCYDQYGNLIYYGDFSNNAPTGTYPSSGYSEYKFQYFELANGDKYIGETKNGKFQGQGIYLWDNGDAWFGEWANGKRNGYGLYMFYSGSVEYGKWVDNKQQ